MKGKASKHRHKETNTFKVGMIIVIDIIGLVLLMFL